MKRNRSPRWLVYCAVTLAVVLCPAAEGINIVFDPFNSQLRRYPGAGITLADFRTMGTFAIKSDTILRSLDTNETNTFQPSAPLPSVLFPERQNQILWRQQDYLQIANAAFKFVWKEDPSGWSLYSMLFDTTCQDSNIGFSRAYVIYYKSFWHGLTLKYTTREIDIYPQINSVEWGADSTYPHPILGWSEIDLRRLRFTADEALSAAEKNGGKLIRLKVGDKCNILIDLLGSSASGWDIEYLGDGPTLLHLCISPYTGNIHKITDNAIISCY